MRSVVNRWLLFPLIYAVFCYYFHFHGTCHYLCWYSNIIHSVVSCYSVALAFALKLTAPESVFWFLLLFSLQRLCMGGEFVWKYKETMSCDLIVWLEKTFTFCITRISLCCIFEVSNCYIAFAIKRFKRRFKITTEKVYFSSGKGSSQIIPVCR